MARPAKPQPYYFDTQTGRAFYQLMKSCYPQLMQTAVDESRAEAGGSIPAVEAVLACKIVRIVLSLLDDIDGQTVRDIDIRHFRDFASVPGRLGELAVEAARALLQNVRTEGKHSKALKSK